MILVTLGTQDKPFVRLLETIDNLINLKVIDEEVNVQAGLTEYQSKNMHIFDFLSTIEFNELLAQADIVISHGGVGTIISAIKENKPVIVAPRLKEYGEHTNNHQVEIIKKLSNAGCILPLWNMDELTNTLILARSFKPEPFASNTDNIINLITTYIDKHQ